MAEVPVQRRTHQIAELLGRHSQQLLVIAAFQVDDVVVVEHHAAHAAQRLCERFGCVVVLKGAGTVVAAPDGLPCVVAAGNPGMASGGSGDVLTGVIAALRAQGREAFDAAATGALLHAVAGDMAAGEGGERGMLASDLFAPLRALVNE